jgi:hypothetical protein
MVTSLQAASARLVRRAMVAADMTQTALSEATGIPYGALGRKLDGLRDFTLGEIGAVAGLLGVPVVELIADSRDGAPVGARDG